MAAAQHAIAPVKMNAKELKTSLYYIPEILCICTASVQCQELGHGVCSTS